MSTNSECLFVEVQPGQWWYLLEHYNAPKNSWDWREHSTAYGPFTSEDSAYEHLRDNHANPGGSCTSSYVEGFKPDEVLQRLIDECNKTGGKGMGRNRNAMGRGFYRL